MAVIYGSVYDAVPVYHLLPLRCGAGMALDRRDQGVILRVEHARMFARPCKHCYGRRGRSKGRQLELV